MPFLPPNQQYQSSENDNLESDVLQQRVLEDRMQFAADL